MYQTTGYHSYPLNANVMGRELNAAMTPELTALGAALITRVSVEMFAPLAKAQAVSDHLVCRFRPDAAPEGRCDVSFDEFRYRPRALSALSSSSRVAA